MKRLIYQMWDGPARPGEDAGAAAMEQYARRIGADYFFARDHRYFPGLIPAYGRFRMMYDPRFRDFDQVLYADTDVWPVDNLSENIFEQLQEGRDLAICTEPLQSMLRRDSLSGINSANDDRWARMVKAEYGVDLPRDEYGVKVYNSGLQLWSSAGLEFARKRFPNFREYVARVSKARLPAFYATDQGYIHTQLFALQLKFQELDNDWNRYVHWHGERIIDPRTPTTKMVHVQLRGAGGWDAAKLRRVVNLPQIQWFL